MIGVGKGLRPLGQPESVLTWRAAFKQIPPAARRYSHFYGLFPEMGCDVTPACAYARAQEEVTAHAACGMYAVCTQGPGQPEVLVQQQQHQQQGRQQQQQTAKGGWRPFPSLVMLKVSCSSWGGEQRTPRAPPLHPLMLGGS